MPEPKEINTAIKQSLDVFLGEDAPKYMETTGLVPSIYSKPVESADDLFQRGLIDQTGKATSKGVLFTRLQDAGVFQPDGTFTGKGNIYSMPYEQTLSPDHIEAFKVRKNDGIDDPDASFSEMAGGVGEFVWDAGAGVANQIGMFAQSLNPFMDQKEAEQLHAKRGVAAAALVDGTVQATQQLGAMSEVGAGIVGLGLGKVIGMDKEAEAVWWSARQDLARTQFEQQSAAVGESVQKLTGYAEAAEMAAKAKEILPNADYQKVAKQSGATGQFLDPTILVPMGAAAKASKVAVTTRLALKADSVLARTAELDAAIARKTVDLAASQRGAITAANASELAAKLADEVATTFETTGDAAMGAKASQLRSIAARTFEESAAHADEVKRIPAQLEAMTTQRASMAVRIPEEIANATRQAIQIGAQAKAIPVKMLASVTERLGGGIIAADTKLSSVTKHFGFDGVYKLLRSKVGQAGAYTTGFTVNPLAIPLGAAGTVLDSGPVLQSFGKFSRVVGNEMVKARGQIPFWQRVANFSELSPAHRAVARFMDTATLGGAIPGAIRRTARGTLAAYPINLAFEMINDGGDPNANTFKRAAAESLVIGGSTAMLGGMFHGTKDRHRELAAGDEINFRQDITDPVQKSHYDGLKPQLRRSIATYAAANPQLRFNFTETGASNFSGNTATINIRSTNPLKALIGHEVMHHTLIRNQMEEGVIALMVGDGEAGGLLRSNTGELDPNFKRFADEYNTRLIAEGREPVSMREAALEYYVDSAADHVAEMATSGELGAITSTTDARRGINAIVKATISKIPIIRDLHFKMGGLMDSEGKMVMGNGLLSEGIRELPQVREMTRQMLQNSAGRSQGLFNPIGNDKASDGGARIPVERGDRPIIDKLISVLETEEINGQTRVKYDKNGDPIPLNPATDLARSKVGLVVAEALEKLKDAGKVFKDGELQKVDGEWQGNHLGDGAIKAIADRKILNNEQVRILRNINEAAKNFNGSRFTVINHPATKKVGKKVRYATLAPTLRDVVPVALRITKDGNILVGLMSATQLHANIEARSNTKRGRTLYNGNKEAMLNDVSAVMELHRQGKRTDAYFDEKYGAVKGQEMKGFVNTLFGLMTPSQADINPVFGSEKIGYKDNVYKTYRLDRISQATRMTGDTHIPMPFVYDSVKMNLMPNGLPTLDANGSPIAKP